MPEFDAAEGGSPIVISGPSGAGKSTLVQRLLAEHSDDVKLSVSYTTRQQRPGEVDGQHYLFVTQQRFQELVTAGDMLEWAEVHGNLYGTSAGQIDDIRRQGLTPILEIDVRGWEQAKSRMSDTVSIFILPPSIRSLWRRLKGRGTEDRKTRWERLVRGREEIRLAKSLGYRWFIVNEDGQQDAAFEELRRIVDGRQNGRIDRNQGALLCDRLAREFTLFCLWQKPRHLIARLGSVIQTPGHLARNRLFGRDE